MNILLINPNREQMPWPAVPLGLCLVATALRRAGHDVALCDLTFSRDPYRDTLRAVRRRAPELVGLTVRNIDNCNFEAPVFYLSEIRDAVLSAVRRAAPSAPVVIGGSGVNVAAWQILHYLEADYAVVGEGERAMPALVAALAGPGDGLHRLPGVLTRGGPAPVIDTAADFGHDRVFAHEPPGGRALVDDLDAVPSESHRWVDLGRYARAGGPYSIQTKRGCALRCVYCVYNNIEGRRYRLRGPSSIVDEIEQVAGAHGVRQVEFVDSTFNLPLDHTLALCEQLARRPSGVKLSTMGINPAATSPRLLSAMKRAGFDSVMCTPESASDVTLRSLQKGYKREAVVAAAAHLRRAGIKTFWFFMFGAPGETLRTVRETLDFCHEHIPASDVVLFTTGIRVFAGTPLERQLKREGWFAADDPLLFPSWYISPEVDLQALYDLLVRAAGAHPNWMTNAETILRPNLAMMIKRGFRMIGWQGPFWTHLPKLFRLTTRLGARQRTLSANQKRVAAIGKVHHWSG